MYIHVAKHTTRKEMLGQHQKERKEKRRKKDHACVGWSVKYRKSTPLQIIASKT